MSQASNMSQASRDPKWVQWILIAVTIGFISLLLILPLGVIFWEALRKGFKTYTLALTDRNARSAIGLTVLATAISVPINMLFGLAAAWMTTKYSFWGKSLLISIIDLPFAISPVIAGLMLILLYGINGWFGAMLQSMGLQVIFAVPGVVLATMFVTVPFVARELIPVMQEQGSEQEWAAVSLGASAWQTFLKVTLPNIRWALLYGALEGLRYGQVTIVIHDGAVVQIDRTEKRRFRNSSSASTS